MLCWDVGEANADIAGIGIIIAFVFQGTASFLLSVWTACFLHREKDTRLSYAEQIPDLDSLLQAWRRGRARFWQCWEGRSRTQGPIMWNDFTALQDLKLELAGELLLCCSDTQILIGLCIAMVLTAIIQRKSLSLCHFRLIYDTVNLVSVSTSATPSAPGRKLASPLVRSSVILFFVILYIVFTAFHAQRLGRWDYEMTSLCYNSNDLALPNAHHPYVEKIYVGITATYALTAIWTSLLLAYSIAAEERSRSSFQHEHGIDKGPSQITAAQLTYVRLTNLIVALLQLPLHLYSIWTLRHFNEPLLASGAMENEWAFAQTYALIISEGFIVKCIKSIRKYSHEKRKRRKPEPDSGHELDVFNAGCTHGDRVEAPAVSVGRRMSPGTRPNEDGTVVTRDVPRVKYYFV